MARAFISYSRKDVDFARRLTNDLVKLGVDIWIDLEDIPAGLKWSTAIQQGLTSSDIMMLVVSPDSIASTNVEDEWQYFLDKHKPLIPVLWKPAELHFQLQRIQYIDFHSQVYNVAFKQLLAELEHKGAKLSVTKLGSEASVQPT